MSIAVFGGTFDPIHKGHLHTSIAIQNHMHFGSYRFVPCKASVLKPGPNACETDRVAMLKRALIDMPQFSIDLREINRSTPSYMSETLASFRKEYPKASISLILGFDAFLSLPLWHQWERLLELAHLFVIDRPKDTSAAGVKELPEQLAELLKTHHSNNKELLLNSPSGMIYTFNAGTFPISSTQIRARIKKDEDVAEEVPAGVYEYIKSQGLYLG